MNRFTVLLGLLAFILFVPLPRCEHEPLPTPATTAVGYIPIAPWPPSWYIDPGAIDAGAGPVLSNGGVATLQGGSGDLDAAAPAVDLDGALTVELNGDLTSSGPAARIVRSWGKYQLYSTSAKKILPVGHLYCTVWDRGTVDMGVPPASFDWSDEADRLEMRGIPMWQWKARCWLWTKHEYEWPADAGVMLELPDSGRSP